jgi:hypothetical protein
LFLNKNIKESENFKDKEEASMKTSTVREKIKMMKRLAPALALLLIFAGISAAVLLRLQKSPGSGASDEFKITGKSSSESACYASILYLDGYEYSPSEWLNYSRFEIGKADYEELIDKKLGEVTLDLKGKTYTGIPPSFSSTYDLGTEIFTLKNLKKERGVLVVSGGNPLIFYPSRKVVLDEKKPINLTLKQVFNMISDVPEVSSVELRSEKDGSWLGSFKNKQLIALINQELPSQQLLQLSELGQDPYSTGNRVPINLVYPDGAGLHMQFFPDYKCAYVFGGFVMLSEELSAEIQKISTQSNQYPNISSLLPYSEAGISYLKLINHTNGDEVLCKNPAWSTSALFPLLDYYRVEEVPVDDSLRLVMTCSLGTSKNDNVTIDFYENSDKSIIIKLKSKYYKPMKGRMIFEELESYLYNYTDLGVH